MSFKRSLSIMLFCVLLLINVLNVSAEQSVETNVASITINDETTFYTSFEEVWVNAVNFSKTATVVVKLYCDWIAGDVNSNGVIDVGETTGTFKFNKDGSEYGSKEGALHLATDEIDMVIDLNGHKIDRGLTTDVSNGQVIRLHNGASLEITDSSTKKTGTVTGGRNNVPAGEGGAVYVDDESLFTLTHGNICGNSSETGGAVYVKDSGSFIMNGGKIYNNSSLFGGAVAVVAADYSFSSPSPVIKLYSGEIYENSATQNGGGVFFSSESSGSDIEFVVDNTLIHNNTALLGGGIYMISDDSITAVICNGTKIFENTAEYGGGIYLDLDSRMRFTDCRVEKNRAYFDGGGVYCNEYSLDAIVGGVTYIYGNIVQANAENAIKAPSNMYLEVDSCNLNNYSDKSLSAGSKIGVDFGFDKDDDYFTASGSKFKEDSYKYFVADGPEYIVRHADTGDGDNRYKIYLTKRPAITSVSYSADSDGGSVTAEITGKIVDRVVIFAGYKDGTFKTMETLDFTSSKLTKKLTGDIDSVKVMIWQNFDNIYPVSDGVEISLTE